VLPGKWRVTSGRVLLKHDKKTKAGVDGANPVFHGLDPQAFELEGEQFNEDERNAVANLLQQIGPQPGQAQNQPPLQLQHPAVTSIGFAIFVKVIGVGVFEHTGPCTTRVKLSLLHWLPAGKNAPNATVQDTSGQRTKKKLPAGLGAQSQANPPPSQQANAAAPPPPPAINE
jgi:hypothetical protein